MRASLLFVLPLAACLGEGRDNETDAPPTDTTSPPPCTAVLGAFDPGNGAEDVALDQTVTVAFSAAIDPENHWSLALPGIEGTATLAADGLSATFLADADLPADTVVQVQAEVCDDVALAAFTTRYAVDPPTLEGRTYAVSYGAIDFAAPALANTLSPADWILVQMDTWTASTGQLDTIAGLGNGSVPEPDCLNSFDAGEADFADNPWLRVGPTDFDIPSGTDLITIEDFTLDARFLPGAGVLTDVSIVGMLDTRGITTINGVCALSGLAGDPCVPCRDGAVRCLVVQATADQADYWADLDVKTTCSL